MRGLAIALALLAASCGGKKDAGGGSGGSGGSSATPGVTDNKGAKVVVSIFPIYDITRRIAGDRLAVKLVLPPGKSEHAYEPSPREIADLDGAKLGIAIGLDMDAWVEPVLKTTGDPRVVHLGDAVKTMPVDLAMIEDEEGEKKEAEEAKKAGKPEEEEHHHHEVGAPDPHVWLDPERMNQIADAIAKELTALDPAGKDTYEKNLAVVKKSITDTDVAIAARAKTWTRRVIVTFHGSMAYFAKRYDIKVAAVVEPVAGREPTASYIADVLAAIKAGKAAALFTEPQLERAPGEAISKEGKIPLGELDPVGGVEGRETYEKLLLWNTDQLEKALK